MELSDFFANSDNVIIRKIFNFLKQFAGLKGWMRLPGVCTMLDAASAPLKREDSPYSHPTIQGCPLPTRSTLTMSI